MKRFLIISLVLVFVVVLMAVPAFAAGSFTITEGELGLEASGEFHGPGKYIAKVFCDFPSLGFAAAWYQLEPFTLTGDISLTGDIYDGCIDGISYFVVDGLRIEVQFSYIFEEGDNWLDYWFVFADGVQVDSTFFAIELIPYSEPVTGEGAVESVFAVFSGIGGWLVAELGNATSLFYHADTGLTVLGVLAVSALGVAVVFVLIKVVQRFFRLRG